MEPEKGILNRKSFLKLTALLLSIYPIKLLFDVLSNSQVSETNKGQRFFSLDQLEGISFHEDIIINKTGEKIRFFSATCPHLGCQINRLDREQLVCPCHGSRFTQEGKVLEGPSRENLMELRYTVDSVNQQYIVYRST